MSRCKCKAPFGETMLDACEELHSFSGIVVAEISEVGLARLATALRLAKHKKLAFRAQVEAWPLAQIVKELW